MSFKQKLSITLVVAIFASLIFGILYSYHYQKAHPEKKVVTQEDSRDPNISQIISPPKTFNHKLNGASVTRPTLKPTFPTSALSLVTRIIDGDTFEIETKQKVRLIGIDTPELNKLKNLDPECFGTQAAQKLSGLILNKKVRMEKDISETDRFGRLLRYVYLDSIFINQQLVESGFAFAKNYPPDSRYKETLVKAQEKARENNSGLWSECIMEQE